MDNFKFTYASPGIQASDYHMDNAVEFSAGVEYAFGVGSVLLAIRGGYKYVPFHGLHYDGPSVPERICQPKGDAENIFAAGFGVVLGKNFQFDVAGNWSEIRREYIGSIVYRWSSIRVDCQVNTVSVHSAKSIKLSFF